MNKSLLYIDFVAKYLTFAPVPACAGTVGTGAVHRPAYGAGLAQARILEAAAFMQEMFLSPGMR
jgi:hypothetical protein